MLLSELCYFLEDVTKRDSVCVFFRVSLCVCASADGRLLLQKHFCCLQPVNTSPPGGGDDTCQATETAEDAQ